MAKETLNAPAALGRDGSYVINKRSLNETQQWQIAHIREGLRQADACKFVPKAEVDSVLARLRRK